MEEVLYLELTGIFKPLVTIRVVPIEGAPCWQWGSLNCFPVQRFRVVELNRPLSVQALESESCPTTPGWMIWEVRTIQFLLL